MAWLSTAIVSRANKLANEPSTVVGPGAMPSRALPRGFALLVLLGAALGLAHGGCGTDAKGIEACRKIEAQRCELAPTCAAYAKAHDLTVIATPDDVTRCQEFFHDQCLNGIENAGEQAREPNDAEASACAAALRAVAKCAGAATLEGCADVTLVSGIEPESVSACGVLLGAAYPTPGNLIGVEALAACAFVKAPALDAGTTAVASPDASADGSTE